MAARKLSESSLKHGLMKMVKFAKSHGFRIVDGTYRVVRKHQKTKMKNITSHTRERIFSQPEEEYCEVLEVATTNQSGKVVHGHLVGYAKGIRFDANEKY